jgi:hypothetical protein
MQDVGLKQMRLLVRKQELIAKRGSLSQGSRWRAVASFGSEVEVEQRPALVRFKPKSRHAPTERRYLLSANGGTSPDAREHAGQAQASWPSFSLEQDRETGARL